MCTNIDYRVSFPLRTGTQEETTELFSIRFANVVMVDIICPVTKGPRKFYLEVAESTEAVESGPGKELLPFLETVREEMPEYPVVWGVGDLELLPLVAILHEGEVETLDFR